jgi:hypothetical protein
VNGEVLELVSALIQPPDDFWVVEIGIPTFFRLFVSQTG